MKAIDLNCDVGEEVFVENPDADQELLPFVTSINVACGFHAGGPTTMFKIIEAALKNGTAVGAHPSFFDREFFGRRNLKIGLEEIYVDTLYQLGAISGFVSVLGGKLNHVKPHGALYNKAAVDHGVSDAFARAVKDFDPGLVLYGLSNSCLIQIGEKYGLSCASEAFADRTYEPDGTLRSRNQDGAIIENHALGLKQALQIVLSGEVTTSNNTLLSIRADTICLHGDTVGALNYARSLNHGLLQAGIRLSAIERGLK